MKYRAFAATVADVCWLRSILRELFISIRLPIEIFADNISVTYLAQNPVNHAHTKQLENDLHFVVEQVLSGDVQVLHNLGEKQLADIFTKGVNTSRFLCKRTQIVGVMGNILGQFNCYNLYLILYININVELSI